MQEAWDGPALVAFADGRHAGACVDRNGLRPARYARTRSGLLALASEAGAVDLPGEEIVEKGRLGPGQMIAVDFEHGRLLRDDVVKTSVASRRPYGTWLLSQRRSLAVQPFALAGPGAAAGDLLLRQAMAGFTAEDVELIVRPMARHAKEPRFSMGNDAPLPILSGKPHVLYDYFTERFAQVTNPAIDPLRERLVMSLAVRLGPRGDLLTAGPEHAHRVDLPSPVLNGAEIDALPALGLPTARVSTAYEVASGPWGLREAVERVCREAAAAVREGAEVVVLSDRTAAATPETAQVPPLLAVGAVHHDLIRRGLRSRASLVSETAQCWSVHHFACLIGYGASAVHPYLAFETVRDLWERGRLGDGPPAEGDGGAGRRASGPADLDEALRHYRVSAEEGLLKILSKMGISLLASYHGAQLFEAVGLGSDLIELAFSGTPSRIGGLSVEELAQETVWIHQQAFPELTPEKLQDYGFVRYRPRGEYHLNNPEAAKTLRRACVEGLPDLYRSYSDKLMQRPPTVLRDLLQLVGDPARREAGDAASGPASGGAAGAGAGDVEPAAAILRRFCTGGMSLGALSREAHETIAVAMARIHGRANSGEGGEDAERDAVIDDVDAEGRSARFPHLQGLENGDRAASQIRQVASGRFGVTTAYLAGAEQLEIKVAQGAKPGEGGELPGDKVTAYIAGLRRAAPGVTLISPPPHHDIYSIEDLAELIYDLRMVNPRAGISVKLVAGTGIGTIAAGVAKAGADVIHVSGHGGGTAAASLNSIKHAGIPWELGLAEVHRALVAAGFREHVRLRVDGDLRNGHDVVVAAALGADEFAFGTAVLLAEGCVMARVCHQNKCPVGVATQDPGAAQAVRRASPSTSSTTSRSSPRRCGSCSPGWDCARWTSSSGARSSSSWPRRRGSRRTAWTATGSSRRRRAGEGRRGAAAAAGRPAAPAGARRRSRPGARATRSTTGCSPTRRSRPPSRDTAASRAARRSSPATAPSARASPARSRRGTATTASAARCASSWPAPPARASARSSPTGSSSSSPARPTTTSARAWPAASSCSGPRNPASAARTTSSPATRACTARPGAASSRPAAPASASRCATRRPRPWWRAPATTAAST